MADDNHIEEWRPVVGWEGIYSVSSEGRVRRDAPGRNHAGMILRGVTKRGRLYVNLCFFRRRKTAFVHKLVAEAYLGVCPTGLETDHVNGAKTDNRAVNLRYVTRAENVAAAHVLGLYLGGSRHPAAKLTEQDVADIRRRFAGGESRRGLSKAFGVGYRTVADVVSRKKWRRAIGGTTERSRSFDALS